MQIRDPLLSFLLRRSTKAFFFHEKGRERALLRRIYETRSPKVRMSRNCRQLFNAMCKLLNDQVIELETRSPPLLIEPDPQRMHQDRSQKAVAQMPQIACPDALELAPIGELSEDGVNARAYLSEYRTLVRRCLRRMCGAERSLQDNPVFAQTGLDVRHPRGTVAQSKALRAFQHDRSHFSVGFIGWSQEGMRGHPRPAQPQMQAKAVKGLPIRMIFARASLTAKANTPGSASKTTNGQRHAVNDADQFIMANQSVTQDHPQALFDGPQVGGLPHKGRTNHREQRREKGAGMASKELKQLLILAQSQITAYNFDGDHLALAHFRLRAGLSPFLAFHHGWQRLVNPTQTGENEFVQAHSFPPQQDLLMY